MRGNLIQHKMRDLIYFTIPSFDETGLVHHCFTSRQGGTSTKENDSLNLSFKTGDKDQNVLENYRRICGALDISLIDLVLSDQVHGDQIQIVKSEDRGKGILENSDIFERDALITNEMNVGLVTLYADCVPIFLLDPVRRVIALAHAGWKGTVLKIGAKTVEKMMKEFQTNPKNILAAIGPSIGPCCYEVDQPVIDKFNENFTNTHKFAISKGNGKYALDLWQANQYVLEEIGVLRRNITISEICTRCNDDLLFSYRAEQGRTGRMAAILQLKEEC